jgi:hypothetical protein
MPKAYSKKYFDENKPKFPLLPQDDYILEIEKIEPTVHTKYHSTEEEKIVKFTFKIVSFRDGEPVVDITGKLADNRKMFLDRPYDEEKNIGIGFKKGEPSILRTIIAFATSQEIFEDIFWEWPELIGKKITAEIGYKVKEDGSKTNKITRFIAPKSAVRHKPVSVDPKDIPIIEEEPGGTKGVNPEIQKMRDAGKVKFPPENGEEEIRVEDIPF